MGGVSDHKTSLAAAAAATLALTAMAAGANGPAATPPPARTLCVAGEKPLFSCPIGRKLVSVCKTTGGPVYRFGRTGHVELSSRALSYASRGYSGGGETQITATNQGHSYTLFERTVRTGFGADGHNDPDFEEGLVTRRGGRTLSARRCSGEAVLASRDAEQALPPGTFVEH